MSVKEKKGEKFDIRLSKQEESVIRLAASLQHTTPTNFIRQQALESAHAVVHDQTRFAVTEEQWNVIETALNQPAKVLPNLRKLLAQSDKWDK